jgi:DNA topoisomerase VI subunit B
MQVSAAAKNKWLQTNEYLRDLIIISPHDAVEAQQPEG